MQVLFARGAVALHLVWIRISRAGQKDLVIWRERWPRLWNEQEKAALAPLAVIEWNVSRGRKAGRDTTHDTAWLRGFARANPKRVGYSVAVRLRDGDQHCRASVARFARDACMPHWFQA